MKSLVRDHDAMPLDAFERMVHRVFATSTFG